MASQEVQDLEYNAGHTLGQAQMRKQDDELLSKQSDALVKQALDNLSNSQPSTNDASYTSQASTLIQQTGEKVKNMAQGAGEQVKNIAVGAADAVKNTLGMNPDNNNNNTNSTTANFASSGGAGSAAPPSSLAADRLNNQTSNYNPSNPRI